MSYYLSYSYNVCPYYSKIVLVAIQEEGSKYGPAAFDALRRLGATEPILTDHRGSYALVGYSGINKPSWVTQQQANGGQGPSEISLKVALMGKYIYLQLNLHCASQIFGPEFARIRIGVRRVNCNVVVPVVRKMDNAIHRRNHYPVVSAVCFVNIYPVDSVIQPLNNRGPTSSITAESKYTWNILLESGMFFFRIQIEYS